MTPEERFAVALDGFKRCAIRTVGLSAAAERLRDCAAQLDAEQRLADERAQRAAGIVPIERYR